MFQHLFRVTCVSLALATAAEARAQTPLDAYLTNLKTLRA
jgi:enolase